MRECAYVRVSTDLLEQDSSYVNQEQMYLQVHLQIILVKELDCLVKLATVYLAFSKSKYFFGRLSNMGYQKLQND